MRRLISKALARSPAAGRRGREPAAVPSDMAIADAPIVSIDTEATGLNPRSDRIVSIAIVRLANGAAPDVLLDRLVNPEIAIPGRAAAIHGITDGDVAAAPTIGAMLPEVGAAFAKGFVVGHSVAFDFAMLARAHRRLRLAWRPPPMLDVAHMAAVVEPHRIDFSLEALAARWGVDASGRHTACGDAIMAGSLYWRLVPALARKGLVTIGQVADAAGAAGRALRARRSGVWASGHLD